MDNFDHKIHTVFREVFDDPNLILRNDMVAGDVAGWDSLTHITLIMTIEDTFNIKFTTKEVMGFQNVGEMLNCLCMKLDNI